MYAHTAMHRPIVTRTDTHRDEKETARRAAFPQPGGRFRWWWQVLGSNQRRLSRRFYRPLATWARLNPHRPGNPNLYPTTRPETAGRADDSLRGARCMSSYSGDLLPADNPLMAFV